jgi:thiamine pyrophosphokinase
MTERKQRVLLVDGSPQANPPELVAGLAEDCDLVLAIDRGAEVCRAADLVPDALVGDMDTVTAETRDWMRERGVHEETFEVEKDYTDLSLAFDVADLMVKEKGGSDWMPIVTCASGGRPDHFLGVIGVLKKHADLQPLLFEQGYEAFVLSPDGRASWDIGEMGRGKEFSLVALEDSVVSEENMYWELDHERIGALIDRGISNDVTTGMARVTCHEGCVLAMLIWGVWR